MDSYSQERLLSIIEDEFKDGTDLSEIITEVKYLIKKYKSREKLSQMDNEYFIKKEFVINSKSWQVEEDNANGQYTILKTNDEYGGFVCQNQNTERKYLIDKDTITYLMSHEKNQDYKFIYIGLYGDMETITI